MGSCLTKTDQEDGLIDANQRRGTTRRFKFIKQRDADVPRLLEKHIKKAYKEGIVSEIEFVLTYMLFTGMLNRLEATMDPLFILQMKELDKSIDHLIQERCKYPPPAPEERYVDMFEEYLLDEIRKAK